MEQYDLIDDIVEEFEAKFDGSLQWSINAWINFSGKRRRSNIV